MVIYSFAVWQLGRLAIGSCMGIEARQPQYLGEMRERYPDKFQAIDRVFARIRRGAKIFVGNACGEPRHLVRAMADYARAHPKALVDAEIFQVWSLGDSPFAHDASLRHFRYNSMFIGEGIRGAINEGLADYTPLFFSQAPDVLRRGLLPVDAALIQVSPPDAHGWMSMGVSVDLGKAAAEAAGFVVAQVNGFMPRVHGDSFINIEDVDFLIPHDEPISEFPARPESEAIRQIGRYVARLIKDGDTLRIGYGPTPNALLASLAEKRHLGIHTEILTDGIVELMRRGVVDNRQKTHNRGKTVAAFCMGTEATYEYIHDNPQIEFQPIDVVTDPLLIARHENMVAINSALSIDLTGEATAVSIGGRFFSGIGGQAEFMRGAIMSRGGRSILAMPSTAMDNEVSRIVAMLPEGSGASFIRGDVHYVVTEYGIAYLHGKSVRERAMALISIAHPNFRPWLVEEAKRRKLIYSDQAFIPGKQGEYPAELEEFYRATDGHEVLLRPVKISDEPLLKLFFYRLSDKTMFRRFMSMRHDMPHERLQEFVVVDYSKETVILAVRTDGVHETVLGIGQYSINAMDHTADVAFVVSDEQQKRGIGRLLLNYLTLLAKKQGLLGFTAEVLLDNEPMMRVFESGGFDMDRRVVEGVYELRMMFAEPGDPGAARSA